MRPSIRLTRPERYRCDPKLRVIISPAPTSEIVPDTIISKCLSVGNEARLEAVLPQRPGPPMAMVALLAKGT